MRLLPDIARKYRRWRWSHRSYAQCGEDLILEYVFNSIGVSRPTYLDIGAGHPVLLSNTYLFYLRGGTGICIEPNPQVCATIREWRPRDICLNVGIAAADVGEAEFYVMTIPALSTFSREEAERIESYGNHKIRQVMRVPLVSVRSVMEQYFKVGPDLVSLDTEGMDEQILGALDSAGCRPKVVCVETLTYTEDKMETKACGSSRILEQNGYFVFADTYLNTILVDQEVWRRRP
jgi:FkbM family methyltransferase